VKAVASSLKDLGTEDTQGINQEAYKQTERKYTETLKMGMPVG